MEYACGNGGGADCAPINGEEGLCHLPNTYISHASYAFNSFYQRHNASPSACDFGGTATIAKADPSYGSCIYPPNPSSAGAINSTPPPSPTITSDIPTSDFTVSSSSFLFSVTTVVFLSGVLLYH